MTKLFAKILSLSLALLMLAGCASAPATVPSTEPATIPFVPDVDLDDDGVLDAVWIRDDENGSSIYKVREDYVGQETIPCYATFSEEEILNYPFVFKGILKNKQKVVWTYSYSALFQATYWYCDFEVKEILTCRSEQKVASDSICKIGETIRVYLNIVNDMQIENNELLISETNPGDEMLLFCKVLPAFSEEYILYPEEKIKATYSYTTAGLVLFKKDYILFSYSLTSLTEASKGEITKENPFCVKGELTEAEALSILKPAMEKAAASMEQDEK
ncbi:MAG: hypothetical protein IKD06_02655 [Clostridia bacterium]|nr:hypothetical protein [Clostridia bacterium]